MSRVSPVGAGGFRYSRFPSEFGKMSVLIARVAVTDAEGTDVGR